jgi:hypothetical protein
MSSRTRLLLIAVYNCLQVFVFLWIAKRAGVDLSKRLIDFPPDSIYIGFGLSAMMLVGFVVNAVLFTVGRDKITNEELMEMLEDKMRYYSSR